MRVVGGQFRGRTLRAPRGRATRPTSDRVREALFDILGSRVVGARVADLFAGTGALGLEALSRGATHAHFFESGREARAALAANIGSLGVAAQTSIVATALPRGLAAAARGDGAPWDLVFADPPWGRSLAEQAVEGLRRLSLVAPNGLIIVEERHGQEGSEADWRARGVALVGARRYGDTALVMLAPDA